MSDVEKQIEQWRNALQTSDAFGTSDIDELENHLREEMERLKSLGLSGTESFLIARHRLGEPHTLENEYEKVNARRRSLLHLSWMVFGVFVYFLAGYIAAAIFRGGRMLALELVAGSVGGALHALIGIVAEVAPPAVLLLIGWVFLRHGTWSHLAARLWLRLPGRLAALLVTLAALNCVLIGLQLLLREATTIHVGQDGFERMMMACNYANLACAILAPVLVATFVIVLRTGEKRCRTILR